MRPRETWEIGQPTQMPQKESSMTHDRSDLPVNACLLQVGEEVIPVYGNEKCGWSVEGGDLSFHAPGAFRYRTLDEIFFALVTLTVNGEGRA